MLDEHGLDAGLSRPGRKIRRGDAPTKQGAVLESAAPTKSAKSSESAAGADDESGRFIVLGLTKKTGGLDTHWGSGSDANSGKNRQRRFFDEHGLDAGLSRPGRKNRQGDALTKQGLFGHSGQCWNRQRRRNRRSRQNRQPVLAMSLDCL